MQIGILGLGKMGKNMALRLARAGHQVVVYNRTTTKAFDLAQKSTRITAAETFQSFAQQLSRPRIGWSMVPAGEPTEKLVTAMLEVFEEDDIIVDGGNSNYKDSMRLANKVQQHGLNFVDVGTSGGIWGLEEGYSLMVGGETQIVRQLEPALKTLAPAPDRGWGHVGPHGAGHFVKMVHNGIEYGLMEAYAEGFEILHSKTDYQLDLHQIAEIWRDGSVVRSWLLDLTAAALSENPSMAEIEGWVDDSGEGRWTVLEALEQDIPAPVITLALLRRLASRQTESYAYKLLASMRNQFGGHAVRQSSSEGQD